MRAPKCGEFSAFKNMDENLRTFPRTEAKLSIHSPWMSWWGLLSETSRKGTRGVLRGPHF